MKTELTAAQVTAIRNLERAIKDVGKSGIMLCGIDDNILYATLDAIKKTPNAGHNYCEVADANQYHNGNIVGIIRSGTIYQDSGGW